MAKKNNTTLRNIGIIIGIVMALLSAGSIIWGFAKQSGNLDRAVIDVKSVESEIKDIDVRVDLVEDAVLLIQYDIEYIKGDTKEILEKLKE